MPSRLPAPFPAVAALLAAAACQSPPPSDGAGTLVEVRDTVADTVVVRAVSGSAWGEDAVLVPELTIGVMEGDEAFMFGSIRALAVGADGTLYATDSQVPALRVFHPDGSHKGTWGRSGGGPGEFAQLDGGLAVLGDGRVVVRDPGNARLQVFSPDGEALATWPVIPGGFNTSNPMVVGRGDTLLTPIIMNLGADLAEWRSGLLRVSPHGEVVDTVPIPDTPWEAPFVEARVENSASRNGVPYAPDEHATWHPDGFFIHGIAESYRFTLLDPAAPLRVERQVELPPVTPAERAEETARTTRDLRYTDPSWRWDGPGIPDRKPPYDRIFAAEDGRIWVYRQGPGVEVEDPGYDPSDPEAVEDRWRDTPLFDVFRRDGTFLGTAQAPLEMRPYPTPVFRGDTVWAVTRDDLDVQRIVRYRAVPRSRVDAAGGGPG